MTSPTTTEPINTDSANTPVDRRCTARSTRTGERCKRAAGKGATVCATHGGRAPQVKAAAKRRQAEEKAAKAVVTYGLPREISPDAALLEEVWRTAGHVQWLGELVQLADASQLTQRGEQGIVTASVWVDLYQRERAHLVAVSKAAIAAGIAERQVRVAEQQGALLAGAVNRILDGLQLTKQQRALVPQVVPAALREITGGGA
jgi:hypothetical protein